MRRFEVGIDDISRSAVERIFIATNGATEGGCNNPQRQGLSAALLDGHRPNNVFGGIPTIATDYSPVWDANVYEWTEEAIEKGVSWSADRGVSDFETGESLEGDASCRDCFLQR